MVLAFTLSLIAQVSQQRVSADVTVSTSEGDFFEVGGKSKAQKEGKSGWEYQLVKGHPYDSKRVISLVNKIQVEGLIKVNKGQVTYLSSAPKLDKDLKEALLSHSSVISEYVATFRELAPNYIAVLGLDGKTDFQDFWFDFGQTFGGGDYQQGNQFFELRGKISEKIKRSVTLVPIFGDPNDDYADLKCSVGSRLKAASPVPLNPGNRFSIATENYKIVDVRALSASEKSQLKGTRMEMMGCQTEVLIDRSLSEYLPEFSFNFDKYKDETVVPIVNSQGEITLFKPEPGKPVGVITPEFFLVKNWSDTNKAVYVTNLSVSALETVVASFRCSGKATYRNLALPK